MKRTERKTVCSILGMLVIAVLLLLGACSYPHPDYSQWDLTARQRDSLEFITTHHYGINYNFKILADSLPLRQMLNPDSLWVYKDDVLVVADFAHMLSDTTDTIWIKVARDQSTMGWIIEDRLLDNSVPLDPISQFIHWFSNIRNLVFLIIGGIFVLFYLYQRRRKRSQRIQPLAPPVQNFYAVLFCIAVVISATLYASMQRFAPEMWEHYYFNPSLNPLGHPFVLMLFLVSVWGIVLVALALIDDLFHQVDFSTGFFYLLGLGTLCMFIYLIVTWTVYYYIGYLFSAIFIYEAIYYLWRSSQRIMYCGYCGRRLSHKGVCSYCGYVNE